MLTDYTNKKVNFFHSKISVKINKNIYSSNTTKIYICSDINNPSANYCLKITSSRNDDKFSINAINTEIIILVKINYNLFTVRSQRISEHSANNRLLFTGSSANDDLFHPA